MLEGHGCVHAHGDDADDGTDAQQGVDPLQGRSKEIMRHCKSGTLTLPNTLFEHQCSG